MIAGTASADITPAPGLALQGHAGALPSESVLRPIEVRSLVLQHENVRAALVSVDVIGITRQTTARIRQRIVADTGIPAKHVMIACSHTHCAPATLPTLGLMPDETFMTSLENGVIAAVTRAAEQLQPVTFALGCGSSHININRRPIQGPQPSTGMTPNYGGIVDRRVRVLRIDAAGGKPLAVLFHYSCHPTSMPGTARIISPDYPGFARDQIETALGCHALFLPGCFGNVRPAFFDTNNRFISATPAQVEAAGRAVGAAAAGAAGSLRTQTCDRLSVSTTTIDFDFAPITATDIETRITQSGSNHLVNAWAASTRELLAREGLPAYERSQMQRLTLGPLTLIAIPGEPVQEIGHRLEKELSSRDCRCHQPCELWAMGYTNDMVGYLVTERQKLEGGYEPNAFVYFDRPSSFAMEEDTIAAAAASLMP